MLCQIVDRVQTFIINTMRFQIIAMKVQSEYEYRLESTRICPRKNANYCKKAVEKSMVIHLIYRRWQSKQL